MSLVIENLSFAYGDVQALQDVSVEAAPGRLTTIIGPNASGKSTLLRCIIGRLKPTRGRVLLDGQASHQLKPRHLAQRVAYVAQRSVVSAAFSIREVVELGRYALPPDHHKVMEAIERLDLSDIATRPYAALSVGQQQRVMLARAVAQLDDEGILLLDEPTSAMDLKHQFDTMKLIQELVSEKVTVLMVLHDLSLAASQGQDAWLLNRGKLVASGIVDDVLDTNRLNDVFEVPFEWLVSKSGDRRLAAMTQQGPMG
ncbi:MAG: ABC transporter ATP-binding protein [Planctomycetota bacterium]|nr:ABC transporter ATP-binding protein [Planctomycetota bacterium]